MEVKKAIKKIAALGAGATMLGATLMGAMAQSYTLADYPMPFVKDGQFDAIIVVGDTAAAEDVVGAVDVGQSLQFAMGEIVAAEGTGVVTISEGVKISKTNEELTLGETVGDIRDILDASELPDILADEIYEESEGETDNEESYTQELRFRTDTGRFVFEEDDESAEEIADFYLKWEDDSTKPIYQYTLEFNDPVKYDQTSDATAKDDFEGSTIIIQGNTYTFTDIDLTNAGTAIEKITLLAGETVLWMSQGKTVTKTIDGVNHEVTMVDVTDEQDSCGIDVDGDVVWIDTGNTKTINGVTVGVTDAKAVHAQLQDTDICRVNIGADKIELEDTKEVKKNGKEIEGSEVTFTEVADSAEFDKIDITYYPKEEDTIFMGEGDTWVDPVLSNFEIQLASVTKTTETFEFSVSGNDGKFVFMNNDGAEVEMPIVQEDEGGVTKFGERYSDDGDATNDELVYFDGDRCDGSEAVATLFDGCDDSMMWVVSTGGESHLLQISDIDVDDNQTDIRDLTYGRSWDEKDFNTDGTASDISLGSIGTINILFNVTDGDLTFNDLVLGTMNAETSLGATIDFSGADDNATIMISEETDNFDDSDTENNEGMITIRAINDVGESSPELTMPTPLVDNLGTADNDWGEDSLNYSSGWLSASKADDDTKVYVTMLGTKVIYDSDNDDDATIEYPDEEVYANVFISPVGAEVTISGGTSVSLNPINVGSSKLASEVAGNEDAQNVILVGGPAANLAAAKWMGSDSFLYGADSGIPEGKGVIKLMKSAATGKYALLVAGYDAADTRRATRVLSKYDEYADDFVGSEIVISGTSLNDITVGAPTTE
ncbi:S-layer protein [Nanoarchaeota archaeon]